ncbi:RNA polymerase sigma factor [Parafrankia sp. EUN1f]|uniref:RNA polymerase sigma factor n=1 Tax=Parafrankia sp. EUN1f TaxID=102897 RepID=UPI0001C44280|nr:sigma-70 family RNA polymerase sigma factor [Parafrankia sp. EUN1f]EFC85359.1 putative RNA polymerase, sigma-24 subunit, ECF subfamily [Parafrankia sp. EUN1f]
MRRRDSSGHRRRRAGGRELNTEPDTEPAPARSPDPAADPTAGPGTVDPDVVANQWRIEFPRLVAAAHAILRDPSLAEQVAQDAFVAAMEQWPVDGLPDRPGAWLMTVTRRIAITQLRRIVDLGSKYERIAHDQAPDEEVSMEDRADGHIDDDILRLMFVCCHPALGRDARVALTLRLLGGLTTQEIARAQLIPSATAGQRISRAKRTISDSGIAFENPTTAEQLQRLPTVLEVIYLIFNEGYTATSGPDWTRPDLAGEAMRLGRMLVHVLPNAAETHGLLALMELNASRFRARRGADGPVLLADQDRMRWDRLLIRRGLQALTTAIRLGGGPYTHQAGIAACHAQALTYEQTDWRRIAQLYDSYLQRHPSPVAELSRGIARWKAYGTAAAREILAPLLADTRMTDYPYLAATMAEIETADGNPLLAADYLRRAIRSTHNEPEKALLARRLAGLDALIRPADDPADDEGAAP